MVNFDFEQMQAIQKELQQKYQDRWKALCPEVAREKLLWMLIEAGEMADVIKKCGDEAIMHEEETRKAFIEEMCDVMMYFNDVMLFYDITPEELEKTYRAKHERNMQRW